MSTSRYYLRQIYAERYGAFAKRELGLFTEGLNVVFGPNEAGKTTFSSLTDGILFGWEDAHGVQNTYRPKGGERSGMLTFARCEEANPTEQSLVRIARVGDKVQDAAHDELITADIDAATYRIMFSFSSDELRSLGNAPDATPRLLSAGSGTAASPSSVYIELEQRIAAITSLSPDASDSVIMLAQQLEDKRAQVHEASRHVDLLKQNDRELRELQSNREDAHERLDALDQEIELLTKGYAELKDIDASSERLRMEYAAAEREYKEFKEQTEQEHDAASIDPQLLKLDANEFRLLRERLDEFKVLHEKISRVEDVAKENSASSTAGYEAMVELDNQHRKEKEQTKATYRKAGRAIASVLPGIVFFTVGIVVFIYGRSIGSLSFTVLSLALIACSFILGIAAAAGVRRMTRDDATLENRLKDAQWVMLQDKKRLDSSSAEIQKLNARIQVFLEESGLGQAGGSLRQASALVDDAQEIQARMRQDEQREAALQLRLETLKEEIDHLQEKRVQLTERLQVQSDVQPYEVDQMLRAKTEQRSALRNITYETSHRIGQLSQELKAALQDTSFDQLKLEAELLRTRLREAKEQLAELLLARRILERAMISWESDSQPRIYEEAGRLLSLITDGRWVGVAASATGSIVAVGCDGVQVKPRHLSLGTCQQLYLALRIALLLTAQDVGKSVPVMTDDILVHFDEERRNGAARVLAELARQRQVIVFTCHQETVETLQVASLALGLELNCLTLERR